MSVRLSNRRSPFLTSGSSSASVTGLSLFHDSSRTHLLDDLTVICGDIKFPLLTKAKDAIVSICIDSDRPKPRSLTKNHESSVLASMKRLFICHSTAASTSSGEEKRQLTRPSRPLQRPESLDASSWPLNEKSGSFATSVTRSSYLSTSTVDVQTLDLGRLRPPPLICQRRSQEPLRIDTGLAQFYPSNAEYRCARHGYGFFPSSPEADLTDSATSSAGFAGITVTGDDLARLDGCGEKNSFEVKKPRSTGYWI